MMRNQRVRAVIGFVGGLLLFLGVARSLKLGLGAAVSGSPVISQIVLKTTLVVVAIVAWKLLGGSLSEMGWVRTNWWEQWYRAWFLLAAAAMMCGSVAAILLGVRHPLAAQMGFLQIVVVIWLLSSFSEEVYVRGLVQSWVADRHAASGIRSAFDPPIVSSALLFAAMHVSLMFSPMGVKAGPAIVLPTLIVGWACAVLRARSQSLWPAIACHFVANVAGVPGGIIGVILYRLVYGRLPEMLSSG